MALESLAPDQRAVVQLVLQQGRSYSELAGLLGISDEAVRQRAQAGLHALVSDPSLDPDDSALVADYLLGQQDDASRESAEEVLASSPAANAWARELAEALAPVARRGLPELPEPPAGKKEPKAKKRKEEPEPTVEATPAADADEPAAPAPARPSRRERSGRGRTPRAAPAADPAAGRPRRERPQRPRRETTSARRSEAAKGTGAATGADAPPPASRLGGFLLIAALGILVAVLVVYMVGRGDEESSTTAQTSSQPSTTASTQQPLAQLPLAGVGNSKAEGLVQLNATAQGQVGFTLAAQNVPATDEGQAYAVWLIGKGQPARRLGFASPVGEDGTLATSGPREADQGKFVGWLQEYSQIVVSRETTEQEDEPTTVIMRASLAGLAEGGAQGEAQGAAPTGTPTP